jgi:hypothetical protein
LAVTGGRAEAKRRDKAEEPGTEGSKIGGSSSVGRASAFQAERRRFEPGLPLRQSAHLAQLVEHVLGKDEVTSSNLVVGSKDF